MSTRASLFLPTQRFIEVDDWANKLGERVYHLWRALHTHVNRRDKDRQNDMVDRSLRWCIEKLHVSKSYFYDKVLRQLWNYHMIDLVEVRVPDRFGTMQTCVNIIVYKFPQNNPNLKDKPLEKVRDYDLEYITPRRRAGTKGGRPAHKAADPVEELHPDSTQKPTEVINRPNPKPVDNFAHERVSVPITGTVEKPPCGTPARHKNLSLTLYPVFNFENITDDYDMPPLTRRIESVITKVYFNYVIDPNTGKPCMTNGDFERVVKRVLRNRPVDLEKYLIVSIDRQFKLIDLDIQRRVREAQDRIAKRPTKGPMLQSARHYERKLHLV